MACKIHLCIPDLYKKEKLSTEYQPPSPAPPPTKNRNKKKEDEKQIETCWLQSCWVNALVATDSISILEFFLGL